MSREVVLVQNPPLSSVLENQTPIPETQAEEKGGLGLGVGAERDVNFILTLGLVLISSNSIRESVRSAFLFRTEITPLSSA